MVSVSASPALGHRCGWRPMRIFLRRPAQSHAHYKGLFRGKKKRKTAISDHYLGLNNSPPVSKMQRTRGIMVMGNSKKRCTCYSVFPEGFGINRMSGPRGPVVGLIRRRGHSEN